MQAENSSKNNLNNKSVRFGHFSTYIKNNLGRAISFVYNDFTDTVSAGPKGGRLKETKCQESSKPLGQVEDEIMKTGAQFFGEELLKWLVHCTIHISHNDLPEFLSAALASIDDATASPHSSALQSKNSFCVILLKVKGTAH